MFGISRKLVTAVSGMVTIAAIVLVPAIAKVPVEMEVQLTTAMLVAGLGGLNVMRQGAIDSTLAKNTVDDKTAATIQAMSQVVEATRDGRPQG